MNCKPTLFKTGVYEILNTITKERKEIKLMLKNKHTMKECALKYNVHVGTIQAIKNELTWFDVKID